MNKPMIVSDEYREGYAAFYNDVYANPYHMDIDRHDNWDDGWYAAYLDWIELVGVGV